jgi:hypothetical protein
VEWHVHEPPYISEVGDRPIASPLARLQAAAGARVTSLRHRLVSLTELERRILVHLDGRHDRDALGRIAEGSRDGRSVAAVDRGSARPADDRGAARKSLDELLGRLAIHALLVG